MSRCFSQPWLQHSISILEIYLKILKYVPKLHKMSFCEYIIIILPFLFKHCLNCVTPLFWKMVIAAICSLSTENVHKIRTWISMFVVGVRGIYWRVLYNLKSIFCVIFHFLSLFFSSVWYFSLNQEKLSLENCFYM